MGNKCGAHTVPYIKNKNSTSTVEHEATTSKINEDQLFYPHSHLQDKNAKGGDRFGLSVSIEDKTLVASYHEAFPEFNWRMRVKIINTCQLRESSAT